MQAPPPADSLRAVVREVFANPEFNWTEQRNPLAFVLEAFRHITEWLDGVHEAHPGVYWTIIGALTGLLIAIVLHFAILIWRALRPRAPSAAGPERSLPARRDVAWHLEEWHRLRGEGLYPEALAHRFTALILQLDRRKAVKFHPAKTPREYVSEATLDDAGRTALLQLVMSLYGFLFGRSPCTADDLDRFEREAAALGAGIAT